MVEAAVLVPIFYKEGEYHILFTLRSNQLTYHKGQVSFPGGACSEVDSSLLDTALRESWEEIGLEAEDVEILGELDDVVTTTGFVISPFIAFIPYPYRFKKNRNEIDEIFDMPLSVLFDKANFRQESQVIGDKAVASYFYEYGGWVIWGATARIVKQFLDVLQFESGAQS
ncbi:MAG TPA: CoA pyrophosphatase [Dehalococcoidia bacterium]|nr:CoA pyrophosphatase [Dehalococcoidia bacterium]